MCDSGNALTAILILGDDGVMESPWNPLGMLWLLALVALGKGIADGLVTSSKRSKITTLGSVLVFERPNAIRGLPCNDIWDCTLMRLLFCPLLKPILAAAYSGNCSKLSGVTTTLYVPGR